MFGRRNIAVLLVVAFSAVGCQEGLPTGPTSPLGVLLSSAPATLTAVPSTGVTVMVDGAPVTLPWKVSFSLVLNLDVEHDPVEIASVTNVVQQAVEGVVVIPTPPGVELFVFDQRPGGSRIEPGGEQVIDFDVWYLLPNGGREAVVTINLSFTADLRGNFANSISIPVAP
tara:strand:+ start:852 stop:1361 length:510 start_codon:yes stop_codon:yes gene_type:complete